MVKLADRVKVVTSTVGTGPIALGAAASGYQTLADGGILNGDTVRYVIEDGNNWEIGTGTYNSTGPTMSRTVIESSNSNSPITLTGNASVFLSISKTDLQRAADMDQSLKTTDTPTFAGMNLSTLTLDGAPVTATGAELSILDGATVTTAEINILDGATVTTAELNILDGVTATAAELNLLDGVTWTPSDYNTLTASATELNILDGVTATTAEINILDGVTATTAELNLLSGVSSFATVATSGDYNDLANTPTLSTVATTGDYSDLAGTPTIPVAGTDFVEKSGGTFTGDVTFGAAVVETVYAISGTSHALNPANGTIQTHTLSGNTTYTESFSAGESITLMVNDGTGYTVTWPTITWVNNGAVSPALSTTDYTVVVLWKVGSTLYGALVGNAA